MALRLHKEYWMISTIILLSFSYDRIGLQAIEQYYQYYFHNRRTEMSYQVGSNTTVGRDDNLFTLLSTNVNSVAEYQRINKGPFTSHFSQSFKSVGKLFKVIDSQTRGVIVPYQDAGQDLIFLPFVGQNH